MDEVRVEILRLAYIRVAQAATLLTQASEELLAEEAEALAEKVDIAVEAAVLTPRVLPKK
jgi:hypothetical protein